MKVYVVYEYAVIEYEECVRNMGVFSSIEKAEAAIKEYEAWSAGSKWRHEYHYEEFKFDKIWEDHI